MDVFETLANRAAARYRPHGITAWQFARGKLRGDPVYRAVLAGRWLTRGGNVLDLGCGQGLMLALIAEARGIETLNTPASVISTQADAGGGALGRLIGIETRPKVAALARAALGKAAEIIAADARTERLPAARTILVFDVLHMMPAADQEALLRGLITALVPGGALLLREADAAAGWRFRAVELANRAKALAFGYSSRGFHFRTATGWRALLEKSGLSVSVQPMGAGTPYGNVLLAGTKAG